MYLALRRRYTDHMYRKALSLAAAGAVAFSGSYASLKALIFTMTTESAIAETQCMATEQESPDATLFVHCGGFFE